MESDTEQIWKIIEYAVIPLVGLVYFDLKGKLSAAFRKIDAQSDEINELKITSTTQAQYDQFLKEQIEEQKLLNADIFNELKEIRREFSRLVNEIKTQNK